MSTSLYTATLDISKSRGYRSAIGHSLLNRAFSQEFHTPSSPSYRIFLRWKNVINFHTNLMVVVINVVNPMPEKGMNWSIFGQNSRHTLSSKTPLNNWSSFWSCLLGPVDEQFWTFGSYGPCPQNMCFDEVECFVDLTRRCFLRRMFSPKVMYLDPLPSPRYNRFSSKNLSGICGLYIEMAMLMICLHSCPILFL